MDERDEIDLIWMYNSSISVSKKHENEEYMDSYFIDIKSCENIFPWLNKFNKIICSSLGHRSYQLLKHLLSLYTQNILTSINTYCEKTLDLIKLKNHISSTLTFFHLYWNDIKEHVGDSNSYLNKMSVLLGIYIDMELKTFKHTMDSTKMASKLLSTLWIYLSNSEKHIFRVLLKLKLVTKKYSKICDLIFMKSFASFKKSVESLTDIDYVRYLLLLKIWKRIKETVEEKKEVNRMALTILGPCTPKMRDELLKILPKVPAGLENETIWLLHPNVFDLKVACNNFVLFEETISVEFKDTHLTKISDSVLQSSQNSLYDVQTYFTNYEVKKSDVSNTENHPFKNEMKDNKSNDELFPIKKGNKFKKYKKLSKLKPGEVILIDLTEEDDLRMGKKKKKKSQRSLEWLKMVKKKYKIEKQIDEVKCKNQVEITDTHSAENSENFSHNILLEYLPISDNKVSESTESYTLIEQKPIQDNIHNSLNTHDHIFNKRNNESKYMFQHTKCDTCTSTIKQTDMQRNKILYLLKLLSAMGQSIKEPKAILNLLGQSRNENMSSEHSFFCRNTANESSEVSTQGKESFSQPKSSIKTIFLSKECQNNITDVQSIKQELPTNTDYNVMEKDAYCQDESVYVQSDYHLHDLRSINSHSSEVIETMKQNNAHEVHECTGCYKNIEVKPFSYHNNSIFSMIKNEDVTQNTSDNNTIDKTSICDKNIMCMLSDLDKCMDVLNRISEHIMTVHAEKQRLGCLDKMDTCSVSTTVSGNQSAESSSDLMQNINSLTNTEKLSRILELYGKKDLLSVCNCQDFHFLNEFHKSTSQSKEYRSYEKNIFPENKSAPSFIHSHIKSEFEQPIKKENNENFEIIKDKLQKTSQHKISTLTNNQICDTSFIHDLQKTKESNRNAHWESTLQNFSQKSNVIKSRSVDEFENIDILDSILNGDITIEDEQEIWEDSQSPLMSPINYDNSNSVLNCITEFFSQSEQIHTNETEEKYILSDTENSQTLLPEGSLGTTGILNSLFDFDLTNMDSPSNDYIYSNIQAVNPRLIKKTFEDEIFSTKNLNISKLNFEEITSENNDLDMLSQRDKEFCNNKNHSVDNSVNIIGFGLNTSKEEVLESPSLTKTTPLFSGQSTILVNSDNISSEEKESFPKCSLSSPTNKFDTNNDIEKSYIFQKKDTVNQIQSFSDIKNRGLPEIYTSNHIPSNVSTNCILNQQEDNVQSSHKYTCVDLETSHLVMKQSLDSCDLLSSTDLITCNTDTYTVEQKDESSLKQRNIQKDKQYNWEEKQNHKTKHRTEISAQSRSSKRTLKCKKKIKTNKEEKELFSSIAQSNQNELSLRCSQITIINPMNYEDMQDTCESPLSTFHTSYCKTSPKNLYTSKNMPKQLNCASVQQLKHMSQEKQQILLNFQEDSMNDIVYKEDHKLENPQCIMEDNITEDLNISVKSHTLGNKSCFKLSKKNMKVDTNITKVNFITDKNTNEDSNNIVKSSAKWLLQNIDIQPSNSIKGQVITTQDEDIPLKKRKLTSKFSPTLKKNAVVYSVNQQKMPKKRFVSTKKGMMCTNKRKNIVGESIEI